MSKVRSVTLDAWEPELLKVMSELGNNTVNRIYLATYTESNNGDLSPPDPTSPTAPALLPRATPHGDRPSREAWIKAKYVEKRFVQRLTTATAGDGSNGGGAAKKWSVQKRKRRSPSKEKSQVCAVNTL